MELSVVICTYNPKPLILERVLDGLRRQTLAQSRWELIIVDNCSTEPVAGRVDLSWHESAKVVLEEKAGLSHARLAGVTAAVSDLIVFADDDNVLCDHYLESSLNRSNQFQQVGCFGGRSIAQFETEPPSWFSAAGINLGCQDFGDNIYVSSYAGRQQPLIEYPAMAPIGTGMVIRKRAFQVYVDEVKANIERLKLGRKGASLSSGEDNDIILTIVKHGFEIGYFPELVVQHLIPQSRYTATYLARMAFESSRTWIKVLHLHGIQLHRPIPAWTYWVRVVRSYFQIKAWLSPVHRIRWEGAKGTFKGQIEIGGL